ncbi:MAG: glycosyltransferase [Acidimicrobiales bacterium]|nr:glycosyltransferase [Acidimicrobiales bacterium]
MTTRPVLLWVTEEVPDRDGGGGAVRQANLLIELARHADIDLLVAGTVRDQAVREAARSVLELPVRLPGLGRIRSWWEPTVRRRPAAVAASEPAAVALGAVIDQRASRYDAVVVHHENLLPLLVRCGAAPRVLHVFDVKSVRADQAAAQATGRRAAWWRAEARASRRAAAASLPAADAVIACTTADLDALLASAATPTALGRGPAGIVAPNGVDLARFRPAPPPDASRVVFLGSLDYQPNVDGIRWFTETVWPSVRARVPGATLTIAGHRPGPEVVALGSDPTVDVQGSVSSAAALLATAAVAVVPLRIGTGSRLKALEAMAAGRATVGTTIGLEGLGLGMQPVAGEAPPAVVADTASELAAAVGDLLLDGERRAAVAAAGRAHVEASFAWGAIADRLAADLSTALAEVPSVPPARREPPGAAVLVCTRGRPELLGDCLASIDAAMGGDDELLVVEADGAHAADLVATLRHPARHLAAPRPGKSRQLNLGLREARHPLVVMTDDDCRVATGWVAAMAAPFADPGVGVVFGNVSGLSGVRGVEVALLAEGDPPAVTWAYANGAAMAVRRKAALAIGGFDERLGPGAPVHGEEHDLVLRLQEAGWAVRIAAAPTVEHLEWRDEAATRVNLVVYSRGAGAFVGLALRRHPLGSARLLVRRSRYQASLWRHTAAEGRSFGPVTTMAFLGGLLHGVVRGPRRFV